MKIELLESRYSSNTVFVDSKTGNQYIYDPKQKKFILKPSNQGSSDGSEGKDSQSSKSNQQDSTGSGNPNDNEPFERNKESSQGSSNRKPQIGDKPQDQESKDIMDREAKERAENDADAERSEEENLARIKRVQDLLDDEETAHEIEDETDTKVQSSRQKKRDIERKKQLKQFQDSSNIEGFIVSLNNFIKNEVKAQKKQTYSKMNKTYNANTGRIIRQGTRVQKNDKIPRINVYFDQSGSWGADDIKVGESAIATLNEYVKKKQIAIDVYIFATQVGEIGEYVGGGTRGTPIMEHIKETRPDNVIVMTDSDISDITSPTTVNGGVWILWRNGLVSENLKDNLHGRKLTKYFNIKGV